MKIIQQDMLELRSGILFHQVNCQGVMGGGIARAFALKFPGLEEAYQNFILEKINNADEDFLRERRDENGCIICDGDLKNDLLLGDVFIHRVRDDLYIANVFGQGYYSNRERMTSYDATANAFALAKVKTSQRPLSGLPLYFPFKMGCGLGGGSWPIYSTIIDHYFPDAIACQHE